MDINIAINQLGLNANSYKLTQSIPPHTIVEWSGPDSQPTKTELQTAYDAAVTAQAWSALRTKRTRLLSDTDFLALSDATLTDDMKTYRQTLRDLPANTTDPANPVWPTKPGA